MTSPLRIPLDPGLTDHVPTEGASESVRARFDPSCVLVQIGYALPPPPPQPHPTPPPPNPIPPPSELRNCVKVEVAVLGQSVIVRMVSVDVKQHLKKGCTF